MQLIEQKHFSVYDDKDSFIIGTIAMMNTSELSDLLQYLDLGRFLDDHLHGLDYIILDDEQLIVFNGGMGQ